MGPLQSQKLILPSCNPQAIWDFHLVKRDWKWTRSTTQNISKGFCYTCILSISNLEVMPFTHRRHLSQRRRNTICLNLSFLPLWMLLWEVGLQRKLYMAWIKWPLVSWKHCTVCCRVSLSPPVRRHGGLMCIAFCLSGLEKKITRKKIHISKSIIARSLKLHHNIEHLKVHSWKITNYTLKKKFPHQH